MSAAERPTTGARETRTLLRTITNEKLATLDPTWARYRGVSVLFDNPGVSLDRGRGRLEDLPLVERSEQVLYDELAAAVESAPLGDLRRDWGFCSLPRSTYHVTVCDGPNEYSLARSSGPLTGDFEGILGGLPSTVDPPPRALSVMTDAPLLSAASAYPVTFAVEGVAIWGHVLAARLEPVDAASQVALDRVAHARDALVEELRAGLGLHVQPWRPHISLGYFSHVDVAQAATGTLPQWDERVSAVTAPITFRSAAVYAFTDMVSFFRVDA